MSLLGTIEFFGSLTLLSLFFGIVVGLFSSKGRWIERWLRTAGMGLLLWVVPGFLLITYTIQHTNPDEHVVLMGTVGFVQFIVWLGIVGVPLGTACTCGLRR